MLFAYNNQQWFNTDCIEHICDTGSIVIVTLKGGKECYVHDRERFLAMIEPKPFIVPQGTWVFNGDYGVGGFVPVDPATLRPNY